MNPQEPTQAPLFYYTLCQVEVIFETEQGIGSHREQFFNKSPHSHFPAAHLQLIQNTAAYKVRQGLGDKVTQFRVHEALIHCLTPLGLMSDAEFVGGLRETVTVTDAEAGTVNSTDGKPVEVEPTDATILPFKKS